MPRSIEDFDAISANMKRKLHALKRDIQGVATRGNQALVEPDQVYLFEAKLIAARDYWQEFRKVFNDFGDLHQAMGEDFPDLEWQTFYEGVRDEVDEAEAIFLRIKRQQRQNDAPLPSQPTNETTIRQSQNKSNLPKISIPIFDGDLTKWTHFKDTFVSMIHNEQSLTNVERFHYLLGSLKGEAASVICRFPIEERTYTQAWEKLLSTYDIPRVAGNMFLKRIIDCDLQSCKTPQQRYERFLTEVADSIESFVSLTIEDQMDFILTALALRSLDPETRHAFEVSLGDSSKNPRADDVIKFVRMKLNALKLSKDFETTGHSSQPRSSNWKGKFPNKFASKFSSTALHSSESNKGRWSPRYKGKAHSEPSSKQDSKITCPFCKGTHSLFFCYKFQNTSPVERQQFVKTWKACENCLKEGHYAKNCPSKWHCKYCKRRHHSLLHVEESPKNETLCEASGSVIGFTGFEATPTSCFKTSSTVLLGTVQFFLKDNEDRLITARGILDSGSHNSFITLSLARKLKAEIHDYACNITGLGGSVVSQPHGIINVHLRSCRSLENIETKAIVVERISPALPSRPLDLDIINELPTTQLSDDTFGKPGRIDFLIGADIYPQITSGAPFKANVGDLYLLPTIFGLAVIGKVGNVMIGQPSNFFMESNLLVDKQLKAFWEIEEPATTDRRHPEDVIVEEHFLRTHTRTETGRYMVELPLKHGLNSPGNNIDLATRRFYALERKLSKDPELKEKYIQSMNDYIQRHHMIPAKSFSSYIIPHHGVMQGQKSRVVFDGSCPSDSGNSLNDILYVGPKLQEDICIVLTRFRIFKIPLCADVVKMYRQVLVHPQHRHLQHIYWRSSMDQPLLEYELLTVTWGLKPSGYLALRSLLQLLADEGSQFPRASRAISRNKFVDDLVTGADTVEEVMLLKQELIQLLAKGGFSLGKWATTHAEILDDEDTIESVTISDNSDCIVKILGLIWNTKNDAFSYALYKPPRSNITKRILLSCIAKIFDPLGFLAPVVFAAKRLLQEIWKADLDWDDTIPENLADSWRSLTDEWNSLSLLSIPRNISNSSAKNILIGFCDASKKGYAAAVYLRSETPDGNIKVSLVKAKTKVAPTKFMTIARLELCGALLLSKTLKSLGFEDEDRPPIICYTDSTVVLAWLHTPSYLLKVFEANRVTEILSSIPLASWRHVSTEDNPSDLASRGCAPQVIINTPLWWRGPKWLTQPATEWPNNDAPAIDYTLTTMVKPEGISDDWMKRFSSFRTLVRAVARLLRLVNRRTSASKTKMDYIDAEEFHNAKLRCIQVAQKTHLPPDVFDQHKNVPKALQSLSPFMDEAGIIRVGGRLHNAPISAESKHPALIPRQSSIAPLIVDYIHTTHFHSGPSLTLAILRGQFWIPSAAKFIRSRINKCIQCRIRKAKPIVTRIAPLPESRFKQNRAFLEVGVDYAGPFIVKESGRRNAPSNKAYLCLFVCMATKALHLEAVTSLSTIAFLSALDRFTARRGLPHTIWSDHGSNFIGASRFLKEVYTFIARNEAFFLEQLAPKNISWKFIPPRAPHFGGLWEAGVRSVKTHSLLMSYIGRSPCTFEELSTAFTKIEAILNSRPLSALSEDTDQFDFLTPGHFIVGGPLTGLPEPNDETTQSPSSRWKILQQGIISFWNRWRKEYLNRLQQRYRWHQNGHQLQSGDLVIMMEKRGLVGSWPVGRVVQTHPGKDGITRVVSVRTPSGNTFVRAVSSLAPLFPTEEDI